MSGMSLIVKTVTRILWPVLLLLGIYISIFGHITPGGGFSGGVTITGAFILSVLSYGIIKNGNIDHQYVKDFKFKSTLITSIMLILIGWIVLFGIPLPKGIPGNLLSAGALPLINIAIGLKIGVKFAPAFHALISTNNEAEGDIH